MTKTKETSALPERYSEMLQKILPSLCPRHDTPLRALVPNNQTGQSQVASVINDQLRSPAKSIKVNKASGLDGILAVALFRMVMQIPSNTHG